MEKPAGRRLEGKVAIITGAGTGIGRTAASLFSREGAKVAIAELNEEDGRDAVTEITAAGGTASFIHTDVSEPESVRTMVERVTSQYGRLDILYNNAGGSSRHDGAVTDVPDEEFWKAIKLDLFGTWLCCRYGIPAIVKSGGGSVINASSVVAVIGWPGRDAYTVAKGGISALTRSLAVEFANDKIRVNAIAPGITRTARVEKLIETVPGIQPRVARHLLGVCLPEDIARTALYLASDDSLRMTGQVLSVDGGASIS